MYNQRIRFMKKEEQKKTEEEKNKWYNPKRKRCFFSRRNIVKK